MSVNSKMTALADEIRELSGTTTIKSIDAMTSDVNAANTEITEQMDLISQIVNALEGKASSGGVTLPSLSNPASASDILSGKEAINSSGNKMTGTIATKTSSDLTASGATVTVPAGYYASNATKSVSTATQATPSVSIDSAGKITASATQTAGYVSAGTKTGTKQLTTQAAKTVTPSTSSQTVVAKNVYTTGAVTVAAIPSNYEDVTAETNTYTSLASQLETAINNLPEVGSGGPSSNIETCTINVTSHYNIKAYVYTAYRDGVIVPVAASNGTSAVGFGTSLNMSDVLCGSSFMICNNYPWNGYSVTGGIEYLGEPDLTKSSRYLPFKAPTTGGVIATLDIYDNE